ncbi:Hpt domain-containing protein [Thalassobaculum sp.]|jgi:chemotaxis protein histidine kinase CheA|uniref:response regulator n=1 Tax=Thalassobaculum sp. TaxID=2022740 RepID=UPI003B5B450C
MALFDDIVANLTQEFLGESSDRLARMQVSLTNLSSGKGADRDAIMALSREIHSVKGAAANFQFRTVATVAHRFEDYMAATLDQTPLPIEDYQRFVDCLSDLIELGREPDAKQSAAMQTRLPALAAFDPTSVAAKPGRALVVIRARTMGHMLSRELANCGFMAQTALDVFDAIRLSTTQRPDIVLTSAVMDGISGVDLINALRAIKSTADLPCAVVTSFDRSHPELAGLPKDAGVVRLGKTLSDDLGTVLTGVAPR